MPGLIPAVVVVVVLLIGAVIWYVNHIQPSDCTPRSYTFQHTHTSPPEQANRVPLGCDPYQPNATPTPG